MNRRKLPHDVLEARGRVKRTQAIVSIALGVVCGGWLRFMSVNRKLLYNNDNYTNDAGMRRRMGMARPPTIDVLSIGSGARPDYLEAQIRTFGSHPAIRTFYPITEVNDTDATCSQRLTAEQYRQVVNYCKASTTTPIEVNPMLNLMNHLFDPTNPNNPGGHGWLCAQKRPVEALAKLLRMYKKYNNTPEYLIIMDDDSFIANMEALQELFSTYPPHVPSVVSGCAFDFRGFLFPWGGYGSFLTQTAIRNFMHPIDCTRNGQRHDRRSKISCAQLERNVMGEKRFFQNNMSVAELMYAYSVHQPFTQVSDWNGVGYCFHSDHALAYFINFYFIALPNYGRVKTRRLWRPLQTIHGYVVMKKKQCHERNECPTHNIFCHYLSPQMMYPLFNERYGDAQLPRLE